MILVITTADTELLMLREAASRLPERAPDVQLASTKHLQDEDRLAELRDRLTDGNEHVIITRVLGGKTYFDRGLNVLAEVADEEDHPFVALPGDQNMDPDLTALSTVSSVEMEKVFDYLNQGGVRNGEQLMRFLSSIYLDRDLEFDDPEPLPRYGLYHPDLKAPEDDVDAYRERFFEADRPVVAVLFYRAHWISGNLKSIDALIQEVEESGANPLPLFCYSLRDEQQSDASVTDMLETFFTDGDGRPLPDVVLNTLSYHMGDLRKSERLTTSSSSASSAISYLESIDVPVIQAMTCSRTVEDWRGADEGLNPQDAAMNVALPEFDGQVISTAVSFREPVDVTDVSEEPVYRYTDVPDRTRRVASLARRWAELRRKENKDKKVAVLLTNFPAQNARVGNAVGLDTPESVLRLLEQMDEEGYRVGDLPPDGDTLIHDLIDRGGYDQAFLTPEQMEQAAGQFTSDTYREWFDAFPHGMREEMSEAWGEPPGDAYRQGDQVYIAGMELGNVFVGIQPPRGFGDNPIAIYHSPDLAPTHHYMGFYRWIREAFEADAVAHIGKHGTLEWLPGKSLALSDRCYPDQAIADLPVFYPFIVNNPGEGTQAKRRKHAVILDHLVPPMTTADTYGDLDHLQQLLDEYAEAEQLNPEKLSYMRDEIWDLVTDLNVHEDLHVEEKPEDPDRFDHFTQEIDGYLCEIGELQIRGGLHELGSPPEGEKLVHMVTSLLRLDSEHTPGIRKAIAEDVGIPDYDALLDEPGAEYDGPVPDLFDQLPEEERDALRTNGDVDHAIEGCARLIVEELLNTDSVESTLNAFPVTADGRLRETLTYTKEHLLPAIDDTTDELDHLLDGLDGKMIPAGPSGAPTRGMPEILPTGRNFYSVDVRAVPSPFAWEVGQRIGDQLLEEHLEDEGDYPESIGIVVWGTSNMRTHGDDIAEILYLLGVRPTWERENRRVNGLEVIPLEELGRPRIDVTVRISGFFRDAFPNLIDLIDEAVRRVAERDEPADRNYVRKHVLEDREAFEEQGMNSDEADDRAKYRIFGSKPGSFGAGILPLLNEQNWQDDEDLAGVYTTWGGYAYTDDEYGTEAKETFEHRLSNVQIAVQNQDNREHDIFDSDDYLQFHGGMVAAVRAQTGKNPKAMFGDTSNPERAKVRDLDEEAKRVFRSRVVNPKWIESMKEHGYKGGLEMAATIDFLYGYDATAEVVQDWMYEDVTDSYLLDEDTRQFLEEKNPWAIRSMSERLLEAAQRNLWEDPPEEMLDELRRLYMENEGQLEHRQEEQMEASDTE